MSENTDRFYLPQPDQPFEGKVDTPIGTLEFSNQYPSKESRWRRYWTTWTFTALRRRIYGGFRLHVIREPPILHFEQDFQGFDQLELMETKSTGRISSES